MHMNIWKVCKLTVARSFWVNPLSCLPFWMTLPTSKGTLSWCSSSVSLSSLAVFFVTRCCLFCPADPVWQAANHRKVLKTYKYSTITTSHQMHLSACYVLHLQIQHQFKASLQVNYGLYQICTESRNLHFLVVSTSSPRLWAAVTAYRKHGTCVNSNFQDTPLWPDSCNFVISYYCNSCT